MKRLLIFKANQLGDNVVFLPVVQWLRRCHPDLEVIVLTSPVAAPLYKTCTAGVRVLEVATGEFNGAWRRPALLRRFHRLTKSVAPDACMLADDQGNVAHLLARTSGARVRVGGRCPRVKLNGLLTHRAELDLLEHIALQNWHILRLTLEAMGLAADDLPPYPPAPDLTAFCQPGGERVTVIHPGASREYKRWPMERYVALANELSQHTPVVFIPQGHASEAALESRVRTANPPTLGEFIALMGRAALFIGNNSGPMNIAAALGTPSIVFNGPSVANWDPAWHANRMCLLRDPALACQPCDKWDHPVNVCQNVAAPMSCMLRWGVAEVCNLALAALNPAPPVLETPPGAGSPDASS